MTNTFIYSLGLLSLFLIIGFILRARVKIFQNLFLPSSVIGGFLLLALPIPREYIDIYSKIPRTLIIPIVASIPLGLQVTKNRKMLERIIPHSFIMLGVSMVQFIVGCLAFLSLKHFIPNIYPLFGSELEFAFAGGHGSVGMLSHILKEKSSMYWNISQGVGSAFATVGLIGGILFGTLIINIGARKNLCKYIDTPKGISKSLRRGYEKDITKQNSLGRETTLPTSLDSFAFHSAIILSVSALSYLVHGYIREHKVLYFQNIGVWTYAIFIMFVVWYLMCKLKLEYLVDSKVKSKLTGMLTEYAIIAAIASMPIKIIAHYILPILVISFIGIFLTYVYIFTFSKLYIKEAPFEHSVINFGMNTGVFITGLLLLRIIDPELESPALTDHTLCYAFTSWGFILIGILLDVWITKGVIPALIISFIMLVIFTLSLMVNSKIKYH